MDYKILRSAIFKITAFGFVIMPFFGCAEKENKNIKNTYYIELVNFTDSLKTYVSKNICGKVSFIKKDKMEILSMNYIKEDEVPEKHIYKCVEELGNNIPTGTQKIRIELTGNSHIDSTSFDIPKYRYNGKEWVKYSDIGFIKARSKYTDSQTFWVNELGGQIIDYMVSSTYRF